FGSIYEHELIDFCPNIDGLQTEVPSGYVLDEQDLCVEEIINQILTVEITEVLPNPVGADLGNEYIEFYNPNNQTIDLADYKFYLNNNMSKAYNVSVGTVIGPGEYIAVYNSELKFTLLNTKGSLSVRDLAGNAVGQIIEYEDPKSGMA